MINFKNVAVLMGGWSAERSVSLNSGNAVFNALCRQGINVRAIDVDRNISEQLKAGKFSHVFNVMHGRGGEDGQIQGVLDVLEIPYTGSGVLGSALTMDKLRCKQLWQAIGLPTPDFIEIKSESDCDDALKRLGLPLIIKPVLEGSSIGISKVNHKDEIVPAWKKSTNMWRRYYG